MVSRTYRAKTNRPDGVKKLRTAHRIIFYSVLFGVTYIILKKINPSISGESGFRLFFYISALTGIIQTINLSIFKKSEDIRNSVKLKYLARVRLRVNLKDRRDTAFLRSIGGIAFSLIAVAAASVMNYYGQNTAPIIFLCAAVLSSLLSIVMLSLTLYEFKSISDLETELLEIQEQNDSVQAALEKLRSSNS